MPGQVPDFGCSGVLPALCTFAGSMNQRGPCCQTLRVMLARGMGARSGERSLGRCDPKKALVAAIKELLFLATCVYSNSILWWVLVMCAL